MASLIAFLKIYSNYRIRTSLGWNYLFWSFGHDFLWWTEAQRVKDNKSSVPLRILRWLGMVVYTCNPSYLGGRGRRIKV
jgi:hypothetical protein